MARSDLCQKQAEKTTLWLWALSINASWKNVLENVQCYQVRIPRCHQGIHDSGFGQKLLTEEFSVLKLTDTCVNLQLLYISYKAKSYVMRLVPGMLLVTLDIYESIFPRGINGTESHRTVLFFQLAFDEILNEPQIAQV